MLHEAPIRTTLDLLSDLKVVPTSDRLRKQHGALLEQFTDAQITEALDLIHAGGEVQELVVDGDDPETAFRRAEHAVLREDHTQDQLQTRLMDIQTYDSAITETFARIVILEKLRESRSFAGFTRVFSENGQSLAERKAMLWRDSSKKAGSWLPAYMVFGEGLYLELDEEKLRAWEWRQEVMRRLDRLQNQIQRVRSSRGLPDHEISARLVLIHTFAHLLMNQLIFDCGYSSASLRERLYVSTNQEAPMAGLLIYTAAGDAEGTMGGLARMGKPGYLEPVIKRAVQGAGWCSSDPICMELGEAGGQGPDSCNLAACHNCALVPETACEQFNKILDRWLVVGNPTNPEAGYFSAIR
jgi:hypothetical protein